MSILSEIDKDRWAILAKPSGERKESGKGKQNVPRGFGFGLGLKGGGEAKVSHR